ncbi:MAG TPA: SPOR domain-containing protein [Bryobacteraceae bacterium]|nr:SPOR domain-containing protein [Bryobacteraceae bacterium]
MAKNEEGEFELVLGNRQLLSVFFIVVILLGVFFTMGYIVGRNSAPAPEVASAAKPEPKPMVVESPARQPASPAPATAPSEEPPKAEPAKPAEKPVTEVVQPEPKTEPEKPKPVEAPKPLEAPKPVAPPAPSGDLPAVGQTYLQLAATTEREARLEVDVLRKKGFQSIAAEIPEKRGTFRVLVGPVAEGGANKMKADLSAAGFPGDKAIRRTF